MEALFNPLTVFAKRLTGVFAARPQLEEMDLERDYPEIDRLFVQEEWPFLRPDLEASHAQPRATAFVARREGRFAGFFAAHHFGPVGYLDMMIVDPAFRRQGIARPLYFQTVGALKKKGIRALVLHTTNDSARLIRLLGFRPGQSFTLLARDPAAAAQLDAGAAWLEARDQEALVELDAAVFGRPRPEWIGALLAQPSTRFLGLKQAGRLQASLCLRQRRNQALCLDMANGEDFASLARVIDAALASEGAHRLECFVKTGSELHRYLEHKGFSVPGFFTAIGPLVEWRKGNTGSLGISPRLQCLSWF